MIDLPAMTRSEIEMQRELARLDTQLVEINRISRLIEIMSKEVQQLESGLEDSKK